jgi:UDP-N-acetylmuramoyl-tripeptide--D-alanyl-D-alanine ligase
MLYSLSELQKVWSNYDFKITTNSFDGFSGVSIDSRTVGSGDIFFAISGETHDGHNFIKNAVNSGAKCVVCEHVTDEILNFIEHRNDVSLIVTPNSLQALTELAIFNRTRLKAKVIGVTGNIGKTTIKEMLKYTLSYFFDVHASPSSYNNHIGLPLTLANAPVETEILVLEMGMSKLGEIEYLSKIGKPDISIITTIAPAHVAFFESVEEICQAKAEIFKGMPSNGIAILNKENAYYNILHDYAIKEGIKNIFTVGTQDSHMYVSDCTCDKLYRTYYDVCIKGRDGAIEKIKSETDGVSYHNAFNTLFSFAIARLFKLDLNEFAARVAKFSLVKGRGLAARVCYDNKYVTVIDDSYNASPESVKVAIKSLANFIKIADGQRAVAIIGDMRELGSKTEQYHNEVLTEIINNKVDVVYTVGECMKLVHDGLPEKFDKRHFHSTQDVRKVIRGLLQDKDVVLFKASRIMRFEHIIDKLYNE